LIGLFEQELKKQNLKNQEREKERRLTLSRNSGSTMEPESPFSQSLVNSSSKGLVF
jgi:hypothetical protein